MKRVLLLLAAAGASLAGVMCTGEEPAEVPETPNSDGGNRDGQTPDPDAGGAQPFPKTIPGLTLWLDGADGNSVKRKNAGSDETVTNWLDKSGESPPKNFVPVEGQPAPTFDYTAMNEGKMSALAFSQPVGQYLKGPSLAGLPAGEGFIVFHSKEINAPDGGPHLTYGLWQFGSFHGAHPHFDNNVVESFGSGNQPIYSAGVDGAEVWKPQIFSVIATLEGYSAFSNAVPLTGGDRYGHVLLFNPYGSLIGANAAYQLDAAAPPLTPTSYFNGFIAEVLIYDHRLPTAHHDAVQQYLSQKWNIPLRGDAGP
ncbi:hypothetical protein LVJ94_31580 [Pendulispora rubella]|uniref:Uncharacterized protein n=1 Tax=Pendulispora rubella TaxID=2741070 RepID=A0ABZ2KRY5_9BACT